MKCLYKNTVAQNLAVKKIIETNAADFCLEGGSRSGKSFLIMKLLIIRASKIKSDHLIARETFNSAKISIWNKTLPDVMSLVFPSLSYNLDNKDHICSLPNKSTIRIAGLDDVKKIERALGTEYSTLWINEANQVSYSAVSKLKTRLAQKNSLLKRVFYDLNPTHTTSWVYQLFHDKVNPQDGEMLEQPNGYDFFKMNPQDNVDNIDSNYLTMLNQLPEKEKKRFLLGEYDSKDNEAAVYSFNKDDHVSETAVQIIGGTIWIGSDFNIAYNSDVIASQTSNGLNVWDEIQIEGDTFKKCHELKAKDATGGSIVSDSTGKNRRTSGKSDHLILKEAGFNVIQTQNPAVVDKIANLNRCFTLGLVRIHPRCKKLIRDLVQLKWNSKGELNQKTDPSLSHLVDSLAYLCWHLYPMVKREKSSTTYL